MSKTGKVIKISSSLVVAQAVPTAILGGVVYVGSAQLRGEIIELRGDLSWIQVYEDTSGLQVGEPVVATGDLLSVTLGPGLLGAVFDGIQRPLVTLAQNYGQFITKGAEAPPLADVEWEFTPQVKRGDKVAAGDILGSVPERGNIVHRILVPPGIRGGKVLEVKPKGNYSLQVVVAVVDDGKQQHQLKMTQQWPIRLPRPSQRKLTPDEPLVTGVRSIDTFFPIAKGGTANIPGPFGAGKTVAQHQIAKWANADIVVYIGCGERGNEMTDVLVGFPQLEDPWTGNSLMDRTVLIANTSNMPIAAREASVYTGITIAEYYRDQGYDVAVMADSTSRWAEALREISGRLEEIPGEEGYPAYLASRIAEFYERSGKVKPLGQGIQPGSVTTIGAISPPGGDISEPVSQGSMQVTKVFWSLDRSLAYARHYPAINWLHSYSLYIDELDAYYTENVHPEFGSLRRNALQILEQESKLLDIIKIVGAESISDADKVLLETAKSLREDFLQQYAFDTGDRFSALPKQALMLEIILTLHQSAMQAIAAGESVLLSQLFDGELSKKISQMKNGSKDEDTQDLSDLLKSIPDYVAGHLQLSPQTEKVDTYKAVNNIDQQGQ